MRLVPYLLTPCLHAIDMYLVPEEQTTSSVHLYDSACSGLTSMPLYLPAPSCQFCASQTCFQASDSQQMDQHTAWQSLVQLTGLTKLPLPLVDCAEAAAAPFNQLSQLSLLRDLGLQSRHRFAECASVLTSSTQTQWRISLSGPSWSSIHSLLCTF